MVTEDDKQEFSIRLNKALDSINYKPKGKGRQVQLSTDMTRSGYKISQKGVRKWLEGEAIPRHKAIKILADKTGKSPDWLEYGQPDNAKTRNKEPGFLPAEKKLMLKMRTLSVNDYEIVKTFINDHSDLDDKTIDAKYGIDE